MRLFFDKGPEFVDLGLSEMQIADESRAYGSRVSPCQVEPMEDAIGRVMRETCDSPQTVTLPQEGQASITIKRGRRTVSKNVCLSVLKV